MNSPLQKEIVPLYSRIASVLRNRIVNGQYEPGSRLPSEEGMAEQFGVSRITVRGALSQLEKEHLIVRSRGKGTFVSERIPKIRPPIYTSVQDIVQSVQKNEIKPLDIEEVRIDETRIANDIQSFFGLANWDRIARIRRILMFDGAPLHYLENFMALDTAKHITLEEIAEKKSIIQILQDNINLQIGRREAYLQWTPAEPDMAEILGCQVFDPYIRVQLLYWFSTGKPLQITNFFMRAEDFKYKITLDTDKTDQ